jgi:hypothetical protein
MPSPTEQSVSRRTAISGLGASGLILALAGGSLGLSLATNSQASAQDVPAELADHPMVGIWLGVTPDGPSPAFIMADGAFLGSSAPISKGADGTLTFLSPQNGIWAPDPTTERGIHFTSVQNRHDASGAFTGTVTVDGYPVASEDGQRFYDDGTRVRVTLRDAKGAVTMVLGADGSLPPVYGNRMAVGAPGFQKATPTAGTPAS